MELMSENIAQIVRKTLNLIVSQVCDDTIEYVNDRSL